MNRYAFLADSIVAAHVAYVAFVILGQIAIVIGWPLGWSWIRNPWFRMIHLAMILVVVVESLPFIAYECPLTKWEYDLRVEAGQIPANYREVAELDFKDISFVGRNMNEIMHYDNESHYLEVCYYLFGTLVLVTLFLVPPRFRRRSAPPNPPTLSGTATAIMPAPSTPRPGE